MLLHETKIEKQKEDKRLMTVCGYCPKIIFNDEESDQTLKLFNDKPICARCRIMRSSTGKQIVKDRKRALRFNKERAKNQVEKN